MFSRQLNQLICVSLNHLIDHESWAKNRLRPFAGSSICIVGLPFAIRLQISETGLFNQDSSGREPEVTLTLPPTAIGLSITSPDQLVSAVKITGAVDIAEALGFVFRNLRWDIESDLAKVIGDIPARRACMIGESIQNQLIGTAEKLALNLIEYSQDESTLLVTNADLDNFCHGVDQLRDDFSRLEQRIRRL